MKKPVVDYREFRLSRINEPRFSHLKLLLGWVGYFLMYILTENLIPAESCHVIHIPLDDVVPFCEIFVVPYVFWYFLIVGSLLWFALYDVQSFKDMSKFIIITQVVAMVIYIIYPSRQDLRPTEFLRENVFTDIVGLLYTADTNTGVFPSLHVAYSIGIASTWVKRKDASFWAKAFVVFAAITISLSTAFIKQHSVADAFGALPVCLLAEVIVFGKSYWMPKFKRK